VKEKSSRRNREGLNIFPSEHSIFSIFLMIADVVNKSAKWEKIALSRRVKRVIVTPFIYSSGEEISSGDRVLIHGAERDPNSSPIRLKISIIGMRKNTVWDQVVELRVFERIFIAESLTDEHLIFVFRQSEPLIEDFFVGSN